MNPTKEINFKVIHLVHFQIGKTTIEFGLVTNLIEKLLSQNNSIMNSNKNKYDAVITFLIDVLQITPRLDS